MWQPSLLARRVGAWARGAKAEGARRVLVCVAAACAVALASTGSAAAQEARAGFRVEDGEPHAGKPFVLGLIVEGFDENPAPTPPALNIPGAKVVAVGAQPSVSTSIQIINGKRSDSREVRWVLRYRVEAAAAGVLRVPTTTVVQGARRATAAGGEIEVAAISSTDDMKLELELPARPVWVGEMVPVQIVWLLRRNASDHTLVVPMLERDEDFLIAAPPVADDADVLEVPAGARTLRLPFEQDQIEQGGVRYTRFRIKFFASPRRAGKVDLGAASVVAELAVGRPDIFGRAATRLFRAFDVPRALEVKDLPLTDRPASFAGAVGTNFGLTASASRSVVQLGEPVELTLTVRSDQRLDALAPPPLGGAGGLPADRFTLPPDPPTGELSADGMTKTFKVSVQVTGPATEIPALELAYFDPVKGAYQTTRSQPIALAVRGGSVVGADDVVAAPSARPAPTNAAGPSVVDSMAGADLVLSAPSATASAPLGGALLWALVAALYALPLGLWGLRSWQRRTAGARGEAAEVRAARKRFEAALVKAASAPASEAAGELGESVRALARAVGRSASAAELDRLETEAYAPSAAKTPLSPELVRQLEALVAGWLRGGGKRRAGAQVSAASVVALTLTAAIAQALSAPVAHAADGAQPALERARARYQSAMALPTTQISERRARFAQAQDDFAAAISMLPGRPELLVDWGNAALGAGDVATATLAYRRALSVDATSARAAHNLALLRSKQSEAYRASAASATGTLFFFHDWPRARRLLVGAAAFALAVLLVVPWRRPPAEDDDDALARAHGRARGARALALVPLAVWVAMTLSLLLEERHLEDAVVMDSVVLRAADSPSAPAALSQPVPRGAEVVVVAQRESWVRIRLASGAAGWVPTSAVEWVVRQR